MKTYRPELPPMPDRIAALPVHRGYPVPWFVVWLDGDPPEPVAVGQGEPDFRIIAPDAPLRAHTERRCWVCGKTMGAYKAFVIGPMCAVNRTSAEPPSHHGCAVWSARACPFLSRPHAKRREVEGAKAEHVPGIMIGRNPQAAGVWVTKRYEIIHVESGILFRLGDPEDVLWFAEGRDATHDEVEHSIQTGLPALKEVCDSDSDLRALDRAVHQARALLPAKAGA